MHKILWDFQKQKYHLISVKRPDLVLTKKRRTCCLVDFAIPVDNRMKLKRVKRQMFGPYQRTKKLWNICSWCICNDHQKLKKKIGTVRN